MISFDFCHQNPFVQQNQLNLETYGKCLHFDESQKILEENILLVCQQAFDYLVRWSINMSMDGVNMVFIYLKFIQKYFFLRILSVWHVLVIKHNLEGVGVGVWVWAVWVWVWVGGCG